MFSRFTATVLKNTGSTARDHLASERTFLAWIRTGLGFVALGIAVERFSQFDIEALQSQSSKGSGTTAQKPHMKEDKEDRTQELAFGLLGTGTGTIVYGTMRYFSNIQLLEKGLFKPAFQGAAGLSFAVAGLTGAACWGVVRDAKNRTNRR